MANKKVFVEPSAAGPTQKLVHNKDGTTHVIPGKAHEAQEGEVLNPGVRTAVTAQQGARCPACQSAGTLRMHPNKPEGKRIYCSSEGCSYDQSKPHNGIANRTNIVGSGVKIIRQIGPKG